ncbi:MAG: hypothetical protein RR407_03735 [Bacteroidales bacterium]
MYKDNFQKIFISVLIAAYVLMSCAEQKKIRALTEMVVKADVAIISEQNNKIACNNYEQKSSNEIKDIAIKDLGGNSIIMNAVKDELSGEMIATDLLNEIVVEAKFRNIAERNGEVDVAFEIRVPQSMQDPMWQVRFRPCFIVNKDTLYSDEVHITGEKYRNAQLKGYKLYNKFLNSIIPDSCNFTQFFCHNKLLNIFIDRNFKQFGAVSTEEAIEYYTNNRLVNKNNKRKLSKDKMFSKFVKTPFITKNVRLDSVITLPDGDLKYHYVQTIKAIKGMRKVEMVMDGGIYSQEHELYTMPQTIPLAFYISSISSFTDTTIRYVKKIIERSININTVAYIDFKVGKYELNDTISNNYSEIMRIRKNIRDILINTDYVADSLVITASCSPEGNYSSNIDLARNRSYSIKKYFADYISAYIDSTRNLVWEVDFLNKGGDSYLPNSENINSIEKIDIRTHWIAEEWNRLDNLISRDTNIRDLNSLKKCFAIIDLDTREKAMQECADYRYIRSVLYPYLRTVKFDFFLHRKGMVKDTIHTTEIDTSYMIGLQALQNRNYKLAIEKLRTYNDYNTAVAYVCLDYNKSALSILKNLKQNANRDYMLAVVYSRIGNEQKAVELYIHACEQDLAMRFRGNLDPEIFILIKKYNINFNK